MAATTLVLLLFLFFFLGTGIRGKIASYSTGEDSSLGSAPAFMLAQTTEPLPPTLPPKRERPPRPNISAPNFEPPVISRPPRPAR